MKEAEQKVVYRRFEQEHLGKLQAPSDITERIKDSGMHGSVGGVGVCEGEGLRQL